MKIIKKANYISIIITLLIVATILICFFCFNKVLVKEHSNNLYTDIDEINAYVAKEKIIEDIIKPKNFSFTMPIFMYHFITDDYGNATDTENYFSPSKLETHLKYIVDNGYQTVYITDIDKLYKYTKPVALTFDDCFVYFYNNAFPLFKKYNLKASIYVITNYINGPNYLTTEQIKEMKESGIIDIQSHSLSHPYLSKIPINQASTEIIDSKRVLKDLFNLSSTVFCYPIGDYNNKVVEIVKENYSYGLNMLGGVYNSKVHSKYNIPRIYANRSMPMSEYINYLKYSKVNANW